MLIKLIGEREIKGMKIGERFEVDFSTLLVDKMWHHVAFTSSMWIRKEGDRIIKIDDVAIFKDGKEKKIIEKLYKYSMQK